MREPEIPLTQHESTPVVESCNVQSYVSIPLIPLDKKKDELSEFRDYLFEKLKIEPHLTQELVYLLEGLFEPSNCVYTHSPLFDIWKNPEDLGFLQ